MQQALTSAVSGLASYLGARIMSGGDYQTPFFIMAVCYLAATGLFWYLFAGREIAWTAKAAEVVATGD